MNWWLLYPVIGVGIAVALTAVDAFSVDSRGWWIFALWLWPLVLPFLVWHGITVLRWKRSARRGGDAPVPE